MTAGRASCQRIRRMTSFVCKNCPQPAKFAEICGDECIAADHQGGISNGRCGGRDHASKVQRTPGRGEFCVRLLPHWQPNVKRSQQHTLTTELNVWSEPS